MGTNVASSRPPSSSLAGGFLVWALVTLRGARCSFHALIHPMYHNPAPRNPAPRASCGRNRAAPPRSPRWPKRESPTGRFDLKTDQVTQSTLLQSRLRH